MGPSPDNVSATCVSKERMICDEELLVASWLSSCGSAVVSKRLSTVSMTDVVT